MPAPESNSSVENRLELPTSSNRGVEKDRAVAMDGVGPNMKVDVGGEDEYIRSGGYE